MRFVLFGLVIASLGLAVGLLLPRELVAAFFRTYTLPTIGIFTMTPATRVATPAMASSEPSTICV